MEFRAVEQFEAAASTARFVALALAKALFASFLSYPGKVHASEDENVDNKKDILLPFPFILLPFFFSAVHAAVVEFEEVEF